jgi:hypothetical protein
VRRTIALVGLPNVVPVFESLEAALDALDGDDPVIPPPFAATPPADAPRVPALS